MSDARQPELDLLYSWAAILPSFSFSRLYTSRHLTRQIWWRQGI